MLPFLQATATSITTRNGYYLLCALLLFIYQPISGTPFQLTPFAVLVVLAIGGWLLAARHARGEADDLSALQRGQLQREFGVYLLAVAGLALAQDFGAGLLVLTVGLFAALETTLALSREWFAQGLEQRADHFRLHPLAASLTQAALALLTLLLLFNLNALLRISDATAVDATAGLAAELLFYIAVLAVLVIRLVRIYAHNLYLTLESQLKALRDAQAGEFGRPLPILSQNELGLLSIQLNRLIEHVHERDKVAQLLQRVVSPKIMEKLLSTDTETLKHGEQREVAILFCDIRGFTELSEATSADEVILFLNSFFSELSEIVSRYDGIINKFMGDAILAVFSTERTTWAIDNAVAAALEINQRVGDLRLPDGRPPRVGIGIHFGRVVAGTIGSEQRYEYTFLGDAVNTSSRLEGLSKRLDYPVIVSYEAYQAMSGQLKGSLVDLGEHQVRGKSGPIHVFGGPVTAATRREDRP